ncbi:MAG TPA: 16S rRNA (cytosine(1402)-N(4))-methyltransferase RsmH [Tepidisphaeraceae bacterium]|nr:16S rRNA (cytosine(1402)-N(4))-methyltransferase RsmH [Tepidisphaeraceae bacterium]
MPRDVRHIPVMLRPVLDVLRPRPGDVLVDCTLGLGGHTAALAARVGPTGRVIATDFDPNNIALARGRLEALGARVTTHPHDISPRLEPIVSDLGDLNKPGQSARALPEAPPRIRPHPDSDRALAPVDLFNTNFAALPAVLRDANVHRIHGLLADVGVASTQIDDPARGFSYRKPGPLDMRMDPSRGQPASALLARLSERELAQAFLELGDETDAPEIARLIVARRTQHPILTTQDLTAIVCEARDFTLARAAGAKLHPAARTFQALRILVNRELANLERLLTVLPDVLAPGGVAAIISFHSGEDRIVKRALRDGERAGLYSETSPDPLTADDREIRENPRSRSAKLRWARRAT